MMPMKCWDHDADVADCDNFFYMKEMYPFLEKCAEYGVNVITTGDEAIYPWNIAYGNQSS